MRKTHVLHVGPKQRGGINTVLRELASQHESFEQRGILFSFFEARGFKRAADLIMFLLFDIPKFFAYLSKGVDIVHLHVAVRGSVYRKYVFFVMSKALRCKTIIHLHSGEFGQFFAQARGIRRLIVLHLLKGAHAVVGVSEWTETMLENHRIRPRMFRIIGNTAHAAEAFRVSSVVAVANQRPYIAFVGKLTLLKGMEDLLVALSILRKRGHEVELQLAGEGDVEFWRARAAAHGVGDVVKFLGWIDGNTKYEFLRDAQLFCMPSHFESFGIATLEAMLLGLPIVGTRLGGFLDLVKEGDTGFLVDARDPMSLADRIGVLLSDQAIARRMGVAAHIHARSLFGTDAITRKYVDVYQTLQNRGGTHDSLDKTH
ncbi:glycosyltransferase family 4 protein [Paraburkholderia terrae]